MTTPRERADEARKELSEGLSHLTNWDDARASADDLLPPGSLVLTADEAEKVRTALTFVLLPSGLTERNVALALLSPTLNVDSRPE